MSVLTGLEEFKALPSKRMKTMQWEFNRDIWTNQYLERKKYFSKDELVSYYKENYIHVRVPSKKKYKATG